MTENSFSQGTQKTQESMTVDMAAIGDLSLFDVHLILDHLMMAAENDTKHNTNMSCLNYKGTPYNMMNRLISESDIGLAGFQRVPSCDPFPSNELKQQKENIAKTVSLFVTEAFPNMNITISGWMNELSKYDFTKVYNTFKTMAVNRVVASDDMSYVSVLSSKSGYELAVITHIYGMNDNSQNLTYGFARVCFYSVDKTNSIIPCVVPIGVYPLKLRLAENDTDTFDFTVSFNSNDLSLKTSVSKKYINYAVSYLIVEKNTEFFNAYQGLKMMMVSNDDEMISDTFSELEKNVQQATDAIHDFEQNITGVTPPSTFEGVREKAEELIRLIATFKNVSFDSIYIYS